MKKPCQALFLSLFIIAGASYSGARGATGSMIENRKYAKSTLGTNLDATPDSAQKPNQKGKKQSGLFNRCTQYVHDKTSSMQEYYDRLDPVYQNTVKFIAAAALARLAYALYARSDNLDISRIASDDIPSPVQPSGQVITVPKNQSQEEQLPLTNEPHQEPQQYINNNLETELGAVDKDEQVKGSAEFAEIVQSDAEDAQKQEFEDVSHVPDTTPEKDETSVAEEQLNKKGNVPQIVQFSAEQTQPQELGNSTHVPDITPEKNETSVVEGGGLVLTKHPINWTLDASKNQNTTTAAVDGYFPPFNPETIDYAINQIQTIASGIQIGNYQDLMKPP